MMQLTFMAGYVRINTFRGSTATLDKLMLFSLPVSSLDKIGEGYVRKGIWHKKASAKSNIRISLPAWWSLVCQ